MMQRFNFYDVYGYLVPGGTLLALLWLPFAKDVSRWPNISSWAGAAMAGLGIFAAYIAGHLVQTVAVNALPSAVRRRNLVGTDLAQDGAAKARRRQPSSVLLDASDSPFVTQVRDLVGELFGIDISASGNGDEDVDNRRGESFLLCRALLVGAKATAYVEQFEGMYTLMRGLALVFYFGAAYLAGWFFSQFHLKYLAWAAGLAAIGCTALAVFVSCAAAPVGGRYISTDRRIVLDRWAAIWIGGALLALGCYLGVAIGSSWPRLVYLPATLLSVFCGLRCFAAYHAFTWTYASEVWRASVAHKLTSPKATA